MELIVGLILLVYFVLLAHFIYLTLPSIRKKHKSFKPYPPREEGENFYEKNLLYFVITRQILLFVLPLAIGVIILNDNFTSQLSSFFVLGLSINVFWVVQLPLLTKANLHVTFTSKPFDEKSESFELQNDEKYTGSIVLKRDKLNRVVCAIYNLGFHTYKNALVILYFGEECEIIPCDDQVFKDRLQVLDFFKKYSVQKKHGGAAFNPKDNYITIPPKEVFLFDVLVKVQKEPIRKFVTLEFSSETSWGKTVIEIPMTLE